MIARPQITEKVDLFVGPSRKGPARKNLFSRSERQAGSSHRSSALIWTLSSSVFKRYNSSAFKNHNKKLERNVCALKMKRQALKKLLGVRNRIHGAVLLFLNARSLESSTNES